MLVRKVIDVNAPLTPEQIERLKLVEAMKDEDIVFDEDCMPLSEECQRKNDYIMRKYKTRRVTKELWLKEFPEDFQRRQNKFAS